LVIISIYFRLITSIKISIEYEILIYSAAFMHHSL